MKDEQVLEKSERIEITETEQVYRLKVKSAVMTDSGSYSVKIANRLGQESRDAKVNVKCPFLYFFYKMGRCSNLVFVTHTVAKKGQQTEFQVKVRGQPMPDVEWLVDTLKVDVLMS